jgi:hypothetical protein
MSAFVTPPRRGAPAPRTPQPPNAPIRGPPALVRQQINPANPVARALLGNLHNAVNPRFDPFAFQANPGGTPGRRRGGRTRRHRKKSRKTRRGSKRA